MDGKLRKDLSRQPHRHLISVIDLLLQRFGSEASFIVENRLTELRTCWMVKLPPDTFCSIANQWLSLKELSILDTAFCSRDLRPQFQNGLMKDLVTFSMPLVLKSTFDFPRYMQWISNRQIKLKKLDLSSRSESNETYDQLLLYLEAHGSSLEDINLSECDNIPRSIIYTIVSNCPKLKSLNVQSSRNVPGCLVALVLERCANLNELVVTNSTTQVDEGDYWTDLKPSNSNFNTTQLECLGVGVQPTMLDTHLCAILAVCGDLKRLNIRHCTALTALSFEAISTGCPSLQELIATDTVIRDTHVINLLHNASQLHTLCVSGCMRITHLGITALLAHSPLLHLEIAHNAHLTDVHVTQMHTSFPSLRLLQVDGCGALTPSGILSVIQHCAVLQVLSAKLFSTEFDAAVRRGIIEGKHWLGKWKDRKLTIYLSSV